MSKEKNPNRVKAKEKVSFFLANMGNIPIMLLLSSFFLIFYTDVVGQGLAGAIPGYVLAATGFVAGAAVTGAVSTGILSCVIYLPFAFAVIAALVFGLGYKLNREDVDKMAAEIKVKSEGET